MKSEHELNITLQIEGSSSTLFIEPMILIPVVENCFKHTDFDSNPDAYIKIIMSIQDKYLKFITLNTKDEFDKQKDKTGGVGLENIKKRLQLNYFNKHELTIQNKKQIFEVNLSMELNDEKDTDAFG
jgi:LytS/YehU family sensor histidine kinase